MFRGLAGGKAASVRSEIHRSSEPATARRIDGWLRAGFAVVLWVEALAWLLSGYLHTGRRLSFLPGWVQDPSIRGAPEVEWAGGLVLLAAAVAVSLNWRGARRLSVAANGLAAMADVIGMSLIAVGAGPDSTFNFWFHRIGIAVALITLGLLLMAPGRRAFRRQMERRAGDHNS